MQSTEQEEEEITWEVKAVLDKKLNPDTNGIEFLIEWKNWDGPPTWEPEENCDCKALIKKFERELKKRQSSSHERQSQASHRAQTPNRRNKFISSRLSQSQGERKSSRISSKKEILEITIDDSSSSPPPSSTKQFFSQPITSTHRKQKKKPSETQPPIETSFPRSISPITRALDSSGSEAEEVYDKYNSHIKQRKLKLKEILGVMNKKELTFVVKWHGISKPELVPIDVLRRFYSDEIIDFFKSNIKWIDNRQAGE